jgi:hypothetical protein
VTAFKLHTPTRKILATLTLLLLVGSTLALSLMVMKGQISRPRHPQSFDAMSQGGTRGVLTVPGAAQVPHFAGNEIVQGRGKVWSLKFVANPADTLQLVVRLKTFPGVTLFKDIDFTLSGRTVTTFNSYPKGTVRAWYQH